MERRIVAFDDERCTGCGLCEPVCTNGAIGMINGRARLLNPACCDGLGACIEVCPEEGAIVFHITDTEPFSVQTVRLHQQMRLPHDHPATKSAPMPEDHAQRAH